MSGIYGYYLKGTHNTDQYDRALTYWNSVYGKNILNTVERGELRLEVCLEHMSEKVPEQVSNLDTPSYFAVIDALIYNRDELAKIYSLDLALFSDEQLIFQIITEHGFDALADINGDFAGVLYDKKSKTFTLFRDHMGVRPLFYYLKDNCFVFSTDMRALLAIPELSLSINEKYLFFNLTDKFVTDRNDCIFNEIHMVRYSSWCTITDDSDQLKLGESHIYWTLGQHKIRLKDDHAYQVELRRMVEESIKRRLNAVDGLVGAELSGGMDSSVIATLINRFGREGRYFSWSYSPEDWPIVLHNDERIVIEAVCKQENISVQYNFRDWKGAENTFIKLTPPYANSMTLAKGSNWFHDQGVRAVFTGHGGDEGVSHRARPYELMYHKEYPAYFKALYNIRKADDKKLPFIRSVRAFVRDIFSTYKYTTLDNDDISLRDFLNPSFYERITNSSKEIPYTFGYDVIEYLQHGFHTNRPMNTAFQASAFGVRYLYPYLDYKVMDYAVSIPRRFYTNGIQKRCIYIDAFRDIMPEELIKLASKDIPSWSSDEVQGKELKAWIDKVNDQFHQTVSKLDPERWSPFLDFDKLNSFYIPDDTSYDKLCDYDFRITYLVYCVKVQDIWDHAIDPVLSGEKEENT